MSRGGEGVYRKGVEEIGVDEGRIGSGWEEEEVLDGKGLGK
jgi:hypothetical protein